MKTLFFPPRPTLAIILASLLLPLPATALEVNVGNVEASNGYGRVDKKAALLMNEYTARAQSLNIARQAEDAVLQQTLADRRKELKDLSDYTFVMVKEIERLKKCLTDGSCVNSPPIVPQITVVTKEMNAGWCWAGCSDETDTGYSTTTYQFCAQGGGQSMKKGNVLIIKKNGNWWIKGRERITINCFAYKTS